MNKLEKSILAFYVLFCLLLFVAFVIFDVENRKMLDYKLLIYISGGATLFYLFQRKWRAFAAYVFVTLLLSALYSFNVAISYDVWGNRGFPPKWEFMKCCDEGIW